MNHPDTPIWMVCQICTRPLNTFQPFNGGPTVHQHPTRPDPTYDHEPIPIPRDQAEHVVMECDFCSSPDVAWIYPTSTPMKNTLAIETSQTVEHDHETMRDHTIRRERMTGHEELRRNNFSPDWAACGPCSTLIDRYDAGALASRVSKLLPARPPQNLLRKFYRDFLRTTLAKRRPTPTG